MNENQTTAGKLNLGKRSVEKDSKEDGKPWWAYLGCKTSRAGGEKGLSLLQYLSLLRPRGTGWRCSPVEECWGACEPANGMNIPPAP